MYPAPKPDSIEQYLSSFPAAIQALLTQVRQVVRQVVPQGEERISYGMPAMFQNGVVVYYAAFKKHLGLYPPVHDPALQKKVARYAGPKGNLQFPFGEPLPLELITEVVRSRLQENLAKVASKHLEVPMSIFRHVRVLNAPPEAVFEAFRDPALLARWWGPEGFRNTFHVFEFREGGDWNFTMHGPDGADYPNQSRFLDIHPPSRIRIQHVNLPHFQLTVDLEPVPGGTHLTWVGDFEDSDFAEKARGFLERANEQNLDRLAEVVASASPKV